MSVLEISRVAYKIEVELDRTQYNILAVALDHMWEHLNELVVEGVTPEVIELRIKKLKLMQTKFEV